MQVPCPSIALTLLPSHQSHIRSEASLHTVPHGCTLHSSQYANPVCSHRHRCCCRRWHVLGSLPLAPAVTRRASSQPITAATTNGVLWGDSRLLSCFLF